MEVKVEVEVLYKPNHKFPYVLRVPIHTFMNITGFGVFYLAVNSWCRGFIGVYNKDWRCPKTETTFKDVFYIYAFKKESDAIAFKLVWC
jgi:hypothetical protein